MTDAEILAAIEPLAASMRNCLSDYSSASPTQKLDIILKAESTFRHILSLCHPPTSFSLQPRTLGTMKGTVLHFESNLCEQEMYDGQGFHRHICQLVNGHTDTLHQCSCGETWE